MARCTFTSFLILEFALLVAAFNDTTTLNVSPFAAFTAGNGLIEIAALTTLIGSQTAEYLALGDRGPIGLPWACLSAFGSFSVIRACITGACPAWLRETLGVRTTISDHSLGMSLDVVRNVRGAAQIKRKEQEAKGISVEFVSNETCSPGLTGLLIYCRTPPISTTMGTRKHECLLGGTFTCLMLIQKLS